MKRSNYKKWGFEPSGVVQSDKLPPCYFSWCRAQQQHSSSSSRSSSSTLRHHAGRPVAPHLLPREKGTQAEEAGTEPQQLLHGREMSRMLQHHHRLQPRPDCCCMRIVLDDSVPAHRRQGATDRRLLLPQEGRLSSSAAPITRHRPEK